MTIDIEVSPSVAGDLTLRSKVENASLILQNVVKNSPWNLQARWDRPQEDRYREFVTLQLTNGDESAEETMPIEELNSISALRWRFNHLYGDLLAKGSRALQQPIVVGEAVQVP